MQVGLRTRTRTLDPRPDHTARARTRVFYQSADTEQLPKPFDQDPTAAFNKHTLTYTVERRF